MGVVVGLVVGLAELAARGFVVLLLRRPQVLRYDSGLGWANVGGIRATRPRNDGRHWRISVDSAGRRKVAAAADPTAPHLVVLGDSFAFGDSMDEDDHFLSVLRRALPVNVHNLGVIGYATDQELLGFRQSREPCQLLLLMTYTGNDLRDNLSTFETGGLRFKPKMTMVNGALVVQPVAHPILARLRAQSYITLIGLTALYRFSPQLAVFDPVELPARNEESIRLYLALVEEILDEAARRGVRRAAVVVWSYRSSRDVRSLVARLEQTVGHRRATVVDLDREFARRTTDPDALYFPVSTDPGQHWTERGHALLGAVLEEVLTSFQRE